MAFKITPAKNWIGLPILFILLFVASSAHGHGGSLNEVAMVVCKDKEKSQSCQYEDHHHNLYIGSCQYASDDDLICVRNKPIQKAVLQENVTGEHTHN